MEFQYNKDGYQKENIQLNNEISTDSSLLKKQSIPSKKYIFYTIKKQIKGKIFLIKKLKKKLNRQGKPIIHSKKSCDNMSRKIKSWVIFDLIKFINKKLGEKILKPENIRLYIINKNVSYNIKIDYNRELLKKKVEDILSNDISQKIKNKKIKKDLEYNKKIIIEIKNNKNNKFDDIIKILDLELLDCIQHFIGNKKIDVLDGFEDLYNNKKLKINNYKNSFENFVKNIEKYYTDSEFRINMNNKMK